MKIFKWAFLIVALISAKSFSQIHNPAVKVSGAMFKTMREGQLQASIRLDTISSKTNLYGLGPLEYLKGELLIVDGKSYVSKVTNEGAVAMQETFDAGAPFFVYTHQAQWHEVSIPETVQDISALEVYLNEITQQVARPFVFRIEGEFKAVDFHIQNLPDGTVVRSHHDAHQGQLKILSENAKGTIIGFFSTEHQRIFTHHDSWIHMHYLSEDKSQMGHIDHLILGDPKNFKLYLPK